MVRYKIGIALQHVFSSDPDLQGVRTEPGARKAIRKSERREWAVRRFLAAWPKPGNRARPVAVLP
jgi:hypothetical protein